jgi:hypothetical protein
MDLSTFAFSKDTAPQHTLLHSHCLLSRVRRRRSDGTDDFQRFARSPATSRADYLCHSQPVLDALDM